MYTIHDILQTSRHYGSHCSKTRSQYLAACAMLLITENVKEISQATAEVRFGTFFTEIMQEGPKIKL